MHMFPQDDRHVVLLFDDEEGNWHIRFVDMENATSDGFSVQGLGQILSATMNPETFAIWLITDEGALCAISRQTEKIAHVPMPPERFPPFDVRYSEGLYWVAGGSSYIWSFDPSNGRWTPVLTPSPPPPMTGPEPGESSSEHNRRLMRTQVAHANEHPNLFGSFRVGEDQYFVGGNGRVIRVRGDATDDIWLDSGNRLVQGHAEGDSAVICGCDPVAEIFRGAVDSGFEKIFESDEPALHMTANFMGQRYIGSGLDPAYGGPFLFTLEDGELVPVETGLTREPEHLRRLAVAGAALWMTDLGGVFRLRDGRWSLMEEADLI